jgi:uncharacterized protein (DUF2384 family)
MPTEREISRPIPRKLDDGPLYLRIVGDLRGRLLSSLEIGRLTGVTERQVYRWSTGSSRPEGESRTRLLELNYLVQLLREIYTDEGAEIWIHGPNRTFGGKRPIELLESGNFRSVLLEIERLGEGIPS